MITLSESQYQEIQNALQWDMAERLPDGRILGRPEKLGWIKDGPDHKVAYLAQRVPLHDKTVLELGSYEGDLTVQLARVSKFVTGLEVRAVQHSLFSCTFVRARHHQCQNRSQRRTRTRCGVWNFRRPFHAGMLYHLLNPVEHMFMMAKISDIILLNTHYYSDELGFERDDIVHDGVTYRAAIYKEYGMDERLSGVTPTSRWLYREDLLNLMRNAGYDQIEIARDLGTKSGPKITLLAQRSVPAVASPNEERTERQKAGSPDATVLEQTKKLFEAARAKADYEETEYRRLAHELKERVACLEHENERYKQDNDYYKKYSSELSETLQGITNSRLWRWNVPLRKLLSKLV